MTAALRAPRPSLLAEVEAWCATLPPRRRLSPVPKPAEPPRLTAGTALALARAALLPPPPVPELVRVRAGGAVHLAPAAADWTLCGALLPSGSWAGGDRITCPACALPPEAD